MSVEIFAERLVRAWRHGESAEWRDVSLPDRQAAYAVQDLVTAEFGTIAGWKVGAKGHDVEPSCAPCPAAGILQAGSTLAGSQWRLRGIEVEVGLRLGRSLVSNPSRAQCIDAIDAVLPVIEIVETRLGDWNASPPLAKLADFQSHGALVIGAPSSMDPAAIDLKEVRAKLMFDERIVVSNEGGNPANDLWRLVAWLAGQTGLRGRPLQAGDIITTGSCTGMEFATPDTRVSATLSDIGDVAFNFAS